MANAFDSAKDVPEDKDEGGRMKDEARKLET
jgi:hypothetical protein